MIESIARFDGVVLFFRFSFSFSDLLENFSGKLSLKELLVMHQFVVSYSL